MTSINNYLPDDLYKPPVPRAALQQYDNYQIYSLFCVDVIYEVTKSIASRTYFSSTGFGPLNTTTTTQQQPSDFEDWVAVQKYSPMGKIACNFDAIVGAYP